MRRILILSVLALLLFLYGSEARLLQLPPHYLLEPAFQALDQQLIEAEMDPRERAMHPARHPEPGVTLTGEGTPMPGGVFMITSHWPDMEEVCGVRVIDREGNTLHTWRADPVDLWYHQDLELKEHANLVRSDNSIHGCYLFPNGDVLFNIEYVGLTRMNAAGDVLWQLSEYNHHCITPTADGNFWVSGAWRHDDPQDVERLFPGLPTPMHEDRCLKVSPDGKVLQEVSTSITVLNHPKLRRVVRQTGQFPNPDILHQNDIDPLPPELADEYPGFQAGDLLISLRDIDTLVVIDPDTKAIKWWSDRYTNKQHDPDWIGDGWISVFDNNIDNDPLGRILGGSRLLAIHIPTGQVKRMFPPGDTPFAEVAKEIPGGFFTEIAGKAQRLPNGNWLLTEATAGRAMELSPEGDLVWQWVQQPVREGQKVFEVMEVSWYPYSPETVRGWGG